MSRKSSSRLQQSQALLIQNPRLYGATQQPPVPRNPFRNRPFTPQIPIIPTPQPINAPPSEPNQLQVLLKNYHAFNDRLTVLITHNGSNYDFRTTLSQLQSDVERLFGTFYKQASQQCTTVPVLQQGIKPGLASGTSTLRKSAIPFLKKWRDFATSLVESQIYGPDSIFQAVEGHFDTVNSCLTQILTAKNEASSNCHDSSAKTCQQYISQLSSIKTQVMQLLSQPTQGTHLKQLAEDVKEYSRRLSESFGREFLTSGLSGADLSLMKTKTYSSCSDVIHGMRAAFLFETDMKQVFEAFDEFQDLLSTILEKLNLPQSYLYIRSTTGLEGTPRSMLSEEDEEDIPDFDNDLEIMDIIHKGQQLGPQMAKQTEMFSNFIKILTVKAKILNKSIKSQNDDILTLELSKEEISRNYEEMLSIERGTNQSMSEELNQLKEEIEEKNKELDYLRHRTEDNEFKRCLRGVARQLGGVMKEESVNFEDDDDQLIQYVNALSVYVVERKCTHCAKYASREEKMKQLLSEIVKDKVIISIPKEEEQEEEEENKNPKDNDSNEEDLVDKMERAVGKVKRIREKLTDIKGKNEILANDLSNHSKCLIRLLEGFQYTKNDDEDLIMQTLKAAQLDKEKHSQEINKLNQTRIDELNNLSFLVISSIKPLIRPSSKIASEETEETANAPETANGATSNTSTIDNEHKAEESSLSDESECAKADFLPELNSFISQYKKDLSDIGKYEKCLESTKIRVANHLDIDPPDLSLVEGTYEVLHLLETTINPLKPLVTKLEKEYRQSVNSMEIIANRLRGITQIKFKDPTTNLLPKDLCGHILDLLDSTQDIMETDKKTQISLRIEMIDYRKTLETIDQYLHRFLELEDVDMTKLHRHELISRVNKFVDRVTSPMASKNFVRIVEINDLFKIARKIVPVDQFSEPKKYIPEVISILLKLDKSVEELKPFSEKLDKIFQMFDYKIEAFNPNSQSFDPIKEKIIEMNSQLEKISPEKINPLIFNVTQRFLTLLSSFASVLEGFKDPAFVTRDK